MVVVDVVDVVDVEEERCVGVFESWAWSESEDGGGESATENVRRSKKRKIRKYFIMARNSKGGFALDGNFVPDSARNVPSSLFCFSHFEFSTISPQPKPQTTLYLEYI